MNERNELRQSSPPVRVALLDSHRIMLEGLASLLESAGATVVGQFTDSNELLSSLHELSPEVLIIDIATGSQGGEGHTDGLEPLRSILHAHPGIGCVVLSAWKEPGVVEEAYRMGVSAYLDKLDASGPSLLRAIATARRHERWASPAAVEEALAGRGAPPRPHPLAAVTPREREVLACVASGADNLKIASLLGLTERTVRAHVSALYRKLARENRTELALLARDLGLRPRQ